MQLTNNLRGALLALLATALFSAAAAMAKVVVEHYHVLQILFFRQVVVFLSSLHPIAQSFPQSLKTDQPLIHSLRLIGAFIALSCSIWAVAALPLTTAISLGFVQVFIIALIAYFFLAEPVGLHRMLAILCGFIGVIIVMRPGSDGLLNVNAFIPVLGAAGAAIAVLSVRKLSQTESTATLLVYQSVFVGALAGIPLFWFWTTPDLFDLFFLLSMGVFAAAGQWVGVNALRLGEASLIGGIKYTELIFATVLGFLIFKEIPDNYTLIGACIIIGSAIIMLHNETAFKRTT